MERIYFDHAATTAVYPEVLAELQKAEKDLWGNASSIHKYGRQAREAIEAARLKVAELIGAQSTEIYFTSGGTESNNTAISVAMGRGTHIITSNVEHKSVTEAAIRLEQERGFIYEQIPVDSTGSLNLEKLGDKVKKKTTLISLMTVNNELGVIQPIKKAASIIRGRSGECLFHTDASQAVGKLRINVNALGVDMLTISGHKFGAPKGVGVLYIRKELTRIRPLIIGGGQEYGMRSGTENVPAICGLGCAASICIKNQDKQLEIINQLKTQMLKKLSKVPGMYVNGDPKISSPYILNVGFHEVSSDLLAINLDTHGIMVSTGSACNEKSADKSKVLQAIGSPPFGGIRISFGWNTTIKEVDTAADKIINMALSIRNMSMKDKDEQ